MLHSKCCISYCAGSLEMNRTLNAGSHYLSHFLALQPTILLIVCHFVVLQCYFLFICSAAASSLSLIVQFRTGIGFLLCYYAKVAAMLFIALNWLALVLHQAEKYAPILNVGVLQKLHER